MIRERQQNLRSIVPAPPPRPYDPRLLALALCLVCALVVLCGARLSPTSAAQQAAPAAAQQPRRPSARRQRPRTPGNRPSGVDYTKFSHATKGHYEDCASCHVTDTTPKFTLDKPDIKEYPDHQACINCHRAQFFRGPVRGTAPAICADCHAAATPRNGARFAFPKPQVESQFADLFPHSNHVKSTALGQFKRVIGPNAKQQDTCLYCHKVDKFEYKAPAGVKDAFVPKPGTFMTTPTTHANCFQCHWQKGVEGKDIEPLANQCADCHNNLKLAAIKPAGMAQPAATPAKPAATPAAKPTTTPAAKPATTTTAKPSAPANTKPAVTATPKPTATPIAKPAMTPTAKPTPAAKPVATPLAKPAATPTAKPTGTPAAKPAATPASKPAATPKPVAESAHASFVRSNWMASVLFVPAVSLEAQQKMPPRVSPKFVHELEAHKTRTDDEGKPQKITCLSCHKAVKDSKALAVLRQPDNKVQMPACATSACHTALSGPTLNLSVLKELRERGKSKEFDCALCHLPPTSLAPLIPCDHYDVVYQTAVKENKVGESLKKLIQASPCKSIIP